MSRLLAAVVTVPIPLREAGYLGPFSAACLALLLLYFVGAEQGAMSLFSGHYVHEFVHDGGICWASPATELAPRFDMARTVCCCAACWPESWPG